MTPYQFVKPESEGNAAHLYILGDIQEGRWTYNGGESPITLKEKIDQCGATELVCHINSYGGATSGGIAMYNLLKNCGIKVTTIAEGFCASAASLVFMAGEKRVMRGASLLMIHNAWTYTEGNAKELRKTAEDLDKISKTAANIYRDSVSIDDETLEKLLDAETWITPEEAVQWGFATEVESEEENEDEAYSSVFQSVKNALRNHPEPSRNQPKPPKTAFQKYFKNFM